MFFLLPLALLWWRLLDHLRLEWTVNPQYAYGWAVPFLCLYLIWKRRTLFSFSAFQRFSISGRGPVVPSWSFIFVAFLYAPTRLIQEANPEWRLVSWALALEVIALTLLLTDGRWKTGVGGRRLVTFTTSAFQRFPFSISAFQHFSVSGRLLFPLAFFLVAVPWPTLIEGPLIQGLTRANTGATVEFLNLLGIPALQHGNVIEVGTGVVGIDEACSGIRSLQATLMLSLFFGELYRLTVRRRFGLVCVGFLLSFLFNLARTTLLSWVAASKGTGAIAHWHDPAGVTILVGCFLSLWGLAVGMGRSPGSKVQSPKSPVPSPRSTVHGPQSIVAHSELSTFNFQLSTRSFVPAALLVWIIAVELGTELWYRSHEWHLPPPVTWTVQLPGDNPTFREVRLSEKVRQFLRYDQALNATWQEGTDLRWQAIFLRWKPGRIAVHLAQTHTPEVCLTAAGRELTSQTDARIFPVSGLQLPFRSYVFTDTAGPLHVFYCLWDDCSSGQSFDATSLNYGNRLAPVLAGRRNSGQRSLELAVWGINDDAEAVAAFQRQLERLVVREREIEDGTDFTGESRGSGEGSRTESWRDSSGKTIL